MTFSLFLCLHIQACIHVWFHRWIVCVCVCVCVCIFAFVNIRVKFGSVSVYIYIYIYIYMCVCVCVCVCVMLLLCKETLFSEIDYSLCLPLYSWNIPLCWLHFMNCGLDFYLLLTLFLGFRNYRIFFLWLYYIHHIFTFPFWDSMSYEFSKFRWG